MDYNVSTFKYTLNFGKQLISFQLMLFTIEFLINYEQSRDCIQYCMNSLISSSCTTPFINFSQLQVICGWNKTLFMQSYNQLSLNTSQFLILVLHATELFTIISQEQSQPDFRHSPNILYYQININIRLSPMIKSIYLLFNKITLFKHIQLYRMKEIVFSLFIVLVIYFYFTFYLKPKKQIQYYKKKFEAQGYRVYTTPVAILFSSFFKQVKIDTKKGDSFKTIKQIHSQYDLSIGNITNQVRISFFNPKLIREFCLVEQDFMMTKSKISQKTFARLAKGLLFSERQNWKKRRRIINNIFNFDFIHKLAPKISSIFQSALEECQAKSSKQNESKTFSLLNFTATGTSDIIMACFLGGDAHKQLINQQKVCHFLIPLLDDFIGVMIDPLTIAFGQKFPKLGLRQKDRSLTRRLKLFDDWAKQYINKKIQVFNNKNRTESYSQKKAEDLIQAILIHNQKSIEKEDLTNIYTEDQILDQFKIFLLAGTDTTSHYLQMSIYYIVKNPQIQSKVRQQIKQYMENEDYSVEKLKKFKYLDAVMKQTTRFYGPANFIIMREAVKDFYIGKVPIKKGLFLTHMSMGAHYSQNYYKKPTEFRPERWLNGECDNLDPYGHLGFSAGPRSCIGKYLALLQTKIGLIKFFKRYQKIEIPTDQVKLSFKFAYVAENFDVKVTSNNK